MKNRHAGGSANRLIAVAMLSIVVLFGVAVYYAFNGTQGTVKTVATLTPSLHTANVARANEALPTKDTDGDGVADWEEVLWGTDPNNPDDVKSPDAQPVLTARNTQNKNLRLEVLDFTGGSEEPLTTTDIVAREFFGAYMYEFQERGLPSKLTREQIINTAMQKGVASLKLPSFLVSDVIEVPTTEASVKTYVAAFSDGLSTLVSTGVRDEFALLSQLTTENKTWAIEELLKTAAHYKKTIVLLKTIPVPSDAIILHATAVSSLIKYVYTFESIADIDKDPAKAALAIQAYEQNLLRLNNITISFSAYVDSHRQNTVQE